MKRYYKENEYGFFYINEDNDNKLYAGLKISSITIGGKKVDSYILLSTHKIYSDHELTNVLKSNESNKFYTVEQRPDNLFYHNLIVMKYNGKDYVVGDFKTLNPSMFYNENWPYSPGFVPFPHKSCTCKMLYNNDKKINKSIEKLLKSLYKKENAEELNK